VGSLYCWPLPASPRLPWQQVCQPAAALQSPQQLFIEGNSQLCRGGNRKILSLCSTVPKPRNRGAARHFLRLPAPWRQDWWPSHPLLAQPSPAGAWRGDGLPSPPVCLAARPAAPRPPSTAPARSRTRSQRGAGDRRASPLPFVGSDPDSSPLPTAPLAATWGLGPQHPRDTDGQMATRSESPTFPQRPRAQQPRRGQAPAPQRRLGAALQRLPKRVGASRSASALGRAPLRSPASRTKNTAGGGRGCTGLGAGAEPFITPKRPA